MKNTEQKQKRYGRFQAIVAIASVVLVVGGLVAWLTPWVWYDNQPKPLGDGLEFVGKKDYGCWLGYCDSKPGTTYYYATNMSVEEVGGYFKKARLHKLSRADSFHKYSTLEFNTPNADFEIKIYTNKSDEVRYINIQEPTKKYIISLPYFDYSVAKKSL